MKTILVPLSVAILMAFCFACQDEKGNESSTGNNNPLVSSHAASIALQGRIDLPFQAQHSKHSAPNLLDQCLDMRLSDRSLGVQVSSFYTCIQALENGPNGEQVYESDAEFVFETGTISTKLVFEIAQDMELLGVYDIHARPKSSVITGGTGAYSDISGHTSLEGMLFASTDGSRLRLQCDIDMALNRVAP